MPLINQERFKKEPLDVNKLQQSKVLVIGAGGLGGVLLEYLARAGIGEIDIADGDTVSIGNLYRQILFNDDDLGKNKAEVAKEKLSKSSTLTKFNTLGFLNSLDDFLALNKKYDLVINASDNFISKVTTNDYAIKTKTMFIVGSIEGEAGEYYFYDYSNPKTITENGCLRCILGEVPPKKEIPLVLGPSVGIIALFMAKKALKLLGTNTEDRNAFVTFIRNDTIRRFKLQSSKTCKHFELIKGN